MKVSVKIDAGQTGKDLAAIIDRLGDCTDGMRKVGKILVVHAKAAFSDAEERPSEWPDLKQSTIDARKRRKLKEKLEAWEKGGKKGKRPSIKDITVPTAPLRDSGELYRSIRVVAADKDSVTVGSDRAAKNKSGTEHSLAAIHQYGTKNGRIPARPFFPIEDNGFTDKVAEEIKDVFGKWLMEGK